jgi:hypothetical protein
MFLPFIILAAVPFIMVLGNSMLIPIFPQIKQALDLTPFQVGLIITLFSLPAGLLIPFAGAVSDHVGRKTIMAPSLLIYGCGGLLAGVASVFIPHPYPWILVGRVIQGIGAGGTYQLRFAHESIFNTKNGQYRCPSTQQGYSAFSTWTRGLAWIILGYAEQLEFLINTPSEDFPNQYTKSAVLDRCLKAAKAAADFYIANTAADGIPYWDTGAPGLVNLSDYLNKPADPYNPWEPVDSSAAAIAAQGLLRLGHFLSKHDQTGGVYTQAGLTVAQTLFQEPYLSVDANHQGLLLHSIYHRPNGWDHRPTNSNIPHSESSMWGDYHLRELAVYLIRLAKGLPYLTFFSPQ